MRRLPSLTRDSISEIAKSHDQIRFFELLQSNVNVEIPAAIADVAGLSLQAEDSAAVALAVGTKAGINADDAGAAAIQAGSAADMALAVATNANANANDAGTLALQALTSAYALLHVKQPDDWFSVWQV